MMSVFGDLRTLSKHCSCLQAGKLIGRCLTKYGACKLLDLPNMNITTIFLKQDSTISHAAKQLQTRNDYYHPWVHKRKHSALASSLWAYSRSPAAGRGCLVGANAKWHRVPWQSESSPKCLRSSPTPLQELYTTKWKTLPSWLLLFKKKYSK